MAIEVHFFLRSTKQRVIRTMDLQWNGPFIWKDGNFACDCNRSLFFYESDCSKEFGCNCGLPNIIVVERIVSGGKEVYADEGVVDGKYQFDDQSDQENAIIQLVYGFLEGLEMSLIDTTLDLSSILSQCLEIKDEFDKIKAVSDMREAFEGAIETAQSIEKACSADAPLEESQLEELATWVRQYAVGMQLRKTK